MVTAVLPEGYKYLVEDEKFSSPTNYECNLRIRGMKTEEDARKWIDNLNECSLVTWKVLRTYPNSGKINIYKGEFRCQHRVHGKRKDMKKSKNTNCPARLRVCIRRYLKSSNAKVPDPLNKLWPCIIELKNTHNHSVESADSLQYRPVNEGTRKKICDLFQLGHSPNSITEFLRLDLLIDNPEEYEERENDASFCPLPGFCYREYIPLFGHSYRGRLRNSLQSELESLLSPYINDTEGGRAVMSCVSDHLVVCICTPIMQNVHCNVSESRSVVHVNILGHPDKKTKVFLFSTWIAIGEVPLGVILMDTEEPDVFAIGLQLLRSILPSGSFFGSNWPEVFILPDDNAKRKSAMQQEFPFSIILSSKVHHLTIFQDFLSDPQNSSIRRELHSELYRKFKIMLNSRSDDFLTKFENIANTSGLVHDDNSSAQTDLRRFMSKLWMDSNGFTHVCRPGIFLNPPSDCSADEGVQILSRLILTDIFTRVKSFNLVQLAHFIIKNFEEFLRRRLTIPAYVERVLKTILPGKGSTNLQKVKKIEDSYFEVPGEDGPVFVDMDLLTCSCQRSRCSHISAVIQKFYSSTIPYPVHLQELYVDLAGGDKKSFAGRGKRKPVTPVLLPKVKKNRLTSDSLDSGPGLDSETQTEAKELIEEISGWLHLQASKNPNRFVPALKSMVRKIESIASEVEAATAVSGFGSIRKPIQVRDFSKVLNTIDSVSSPNPTVLPTTQEQDELTFMTVETQRENLMAGVSPNTTYIPLQEIPGEDGNPSYYILVSEGDEGKGIFTTTDAIEETLPIISVQNFKEGQFPTKNVINKEQVGLVS